MRLTCETVVTGWTQNQAAHARLNLMEHEPLGHLCSGSPLFWGDTQINRGLRVLSGKLARWILHFCKIKSRTGANSITYLFMHHEGFDGKTKSKKKYKRIALWNAYLVFQHIVLCQFDKRSQKELWHSIINWQCLNYRTYFSLGFLIQINQ